MTRTDIGWLGLAASLILVAVAVAVSRWQRLRLERELVVACVRGLAQLLVVGFALGLVFSPDASIAWSWLWSVGIVAFAALTVRRRAPALPGVLPAALVGLGGALALCFAVAMGIGIFPIEPQVVVPVAGMIVGNSMKATVVVAMRLVDQVAERRLELEARLALGWTGSDAIRPTVRAALRVALVPTIENVRGLGLVFLPGAMTGLILAGVEPRDAVLVQAAIMFLILGGTAIASTALALMTSRRLFTPDLRPIAIARTAQHEG